MTNPTFVQEDYAFGADDGGLGANTLDTINTNRTAQPVDTNYRLRVVVQQTTSGKAVNNQIFHLYYSYNGGAWTQVPTAGAPVILNNDVNGIADNSATSQRIGNGTYIIGESFGYDDGVTDVGTGSIDYEGGDEAELEFTLYSPAANVADGDTIAFQVRLADGTQLNSYLTSPQVTISESVSAVTVNANVGQLVSAGLAALVSPGPRQISGNVGALTATGQVGGVSAGTGGVTVQTGTVQLGSGSGSVDATIAAVDLTKAFLLFTVDRSSGAGTSPENSAITGQLVNTTTARFQRVNTAATAVYDIRWKVIEYDGGVTVQRGSEVLDVNTNDVTINAVDLSKTFAIATFRGDGTTWSNDDFVRARFPDNTTLNLSLFSGGGTQKVCEWQVVEFDGATVHRGDITFATGDLTRQAAIGATVDLNTSWLLFSYHTDAGTSTDIGQKMVRGSIDAGATSITFTRANSGQQINVAWFVVDFNNGTTVQTGTEAISANNETASVTINSVDTARAVAVAAGLQQTCGTTPYNTNDDLDEARADLYLSSATQLEINRCAFSADSAFDWQVIEFAGAAATSTTINANVGQLTASGQPSVVFQDVTILANVGTLTASGQTAANVQGNARINANVGDLTATGQAATVAAGQAVVTANAPGLLTSVGQAANLQAGPVSLGAQTAALLAQGQAATVTGDTTRVLVGWARMRIPFTATQEILAGAGALTAAGQLADVLPGAVQINAQTGDLTAAGQPATLAAGATTVQANTGQLTTTGQHATVRKTVLAQTGQLTTAGQLADVVPGAATVASTTGALTAAGERAALSFIVQIDANTGQLTITGQAAGVRQDVTIQANTGELRAQGQTGTIAKGAAILAGTGKLTAAGQQAVLATGPKVVTANAPGELTAQGQGATVLKGVAIQAGTGDATAEGQQADVQPGAVTIQANTADLTTAGQTATVAVGAAPVAAHVGRVTAAGQQATVTPGTATVAAQSGELSADGQAGAVGAQTIIQAQAADLGASGQPVSVGAGAVQIDATAGLLTAAGLGATISTGLVTILAALGDLQATGAAAVVESLLFDNIIVGLTDSPTHSVGLADELANDLGVSDQTGYNMSVEDS